jgi:hypothetical protein
MSAVSMYRNYAGHIPDRSKFKLYLFLWRTALTSKIKIYSTIIAAALFASVFALPAYAQDSVSQTKPVIKDSLGRTLEAGEAGSLVILSTTNTNESSDSVSYVALMEVRDSQGVTVYLQFQFGNLPPDGESELGISWTPESAGEYELRTFLISGFIDPVTVLTPVQSNIVTIN